MLLTMITLIATLLFSTTSPRYCNEIYDELMTAVEYQVLTLREAEDIYRRCLVLEY